MNWYKKIALKTLKDIAFDPNPNSEKDNWEEQHKESDTDAIMLRMYQNEEDPEGIKEEDIEEAIRSLQSHEGALGMWGYLERKKPKYLKKIKHKVKKKYKEFYEKTKSGSEGQISLQEEGDGGQGGAPGGMDLGGLGL